MKRLLSVGILAIAVSIAGSLNAAAATLTFMTIPGISGESTYQGYEQAIELSSITQSFAAGAKPNGACSVSVSIGLDRSGPLLWAAAVTGQVFTDVRIDILKTGVEPLRFYSLTITNASVVAITSNPNLLTETLTLVGTSATLSYYPQKPDGSIGPPVTSTITCK